jgi:hypothetical protein
MIFTVGFAELFSQRFSVGRFFAALQTQDNGRGSWTKRFAMLQAYKIFNFRPTQN